MTASTAEIAAAQTALADEHAAIWAYGVLGPRAGSRQSLAGLTFVQHRAARDVLVEWLRATGATPVGTRAGYRLPFALAGSSDAAALARRLEDGCGNAYAALLGVAQDASLRQLAVTELVSCAHRRVSWGGIPQTFPGLPRQK
jgi:Domain of unknown function (DUF4439)